MDTLHFTETPKQCPHTKTPPQVTDVAARDSFLKQATKNYTLSGCEVPHKELSKLSLGEYSGYSETSDKL